MEVICLDLEGVLVPEIWIEFAEISGIEGLKATTRDVPDYDQLMTQRLDYLDKNKLGLPDIQRVISQMSPMDGARDFLDGLRSHFQVFILSDTFYEFASPLMEQLGWPTLLCHRLEINAEGHVINYHIRQKDPKRKSVQAIKSLNYQVFAAGDSYNDVSMLQEANAGFFYCPPDNVLHDYPQFEVATNYDELASFFEGARAK